MNKKDSAHPTALTDLKITQKKSKRCFPASYKLKILQEADNCKKPGQIAALLRREALYSSYLSTWRKQREKGILCETVLKKYGINNKSKNYIAEVIVRLEEENLQLRLKLNQAETIIKIQKKTSQIMEFSHGITMRPFG